MMPTNYITQCLTDACNWVSSEAVLSNTTVDRQSPSFLISELMIWGPQMGTLKMADNIKLFYTKCCPLCSIKLWTLWWTHCIFMPISTADHTIYRCSLSAQSDLWFYSSVSGRLSISSYDVTRPGRCRGDRRLCRVFSFIQSLCNSYCAHTVL